MRIAPGPALALAAGLTLACQPGGTGTPDEAVDDPTTSGVEERLDRYTSVRLSPDLSGVTDAQRRMIPLLIDAAREMDSLSERILTLQGDGDYEGVLEGVPS